MRLHDSTTNNNHLNKNNFFKTNLVASIVQGHSNLVGSIVKMIFALAKYMRKRFKKRNCI